MTHLPALEGPALPRPSITGRRAFLVAASAALFGHSAQAAPEPLIFAPENPDEIGAQVQVAPEAALESLPLGQIPADFWLRPRELLLKRSPTGEVVREVYWRDGQLVADGYWRICALLRDARANVMTAMDPAILDVLRGIVGYYQAWQWPHPVVITSGYRTLNTNNALQSEGAAKNSMHLYGKATDLYVPGIPAQHVGTLAALLRQGGVGFYPAKGFTHMDTGRLRVWRG